MFEIAETFETYTATQCIAVATYATSYLLLQHTYGTHEYTVGTCAHLIAAAQ
jgi:hypothetical protein